MIYYMDIIEILFWIALFGLDEIFVKFMKYSEFQKFMHYILIIIIVFCMRKAKIVI